MSVRAPARWSRWRAIAAERTTAAWVGPDRSGPPIVWLGDEPTVVDQLALVVALRRASLASFWWLALLFALGGVAAGVLGPSPFLAAPFHMFTVVFGLCALAFQAVWRRQRLATGYRTAHRGLATWGQLVRGYGYYGLAILVLVVAGGLSSGRWTTDGWEVILLVWVAGCALITLVLLPTLLILGRRGEGLARFLRLRPDVLAELREIERTYPRGAARPFGAIPAS